MKKNLILIGLALALVLSLSACGKAPAAEPAAPAAEPQTAEAPVEAAPAPAVSDGQNPVMNFVGVYHMDDSTEALVEADGASDAKITIRFAYTPWFQNQKVMSGSFDAGTLTLSFTNATITGYTYNSDGTVAEASVGYDDGVGRAVFNPADNTMTLTELFDTDEYETVFTWGPAPDMKSVSDPDHYASVTAMDKAQVETVAAFNARMAYLSEDWFAMADMIRYPITINGTELADADAFLGYMMDKTVSESDRDAMMAETSLDMYVDNQGIRMGDGQIWLSDPNFGTGASPVLEVIALGGIVER